MTEISYRYCHFPPVIIQYTVRPLDLRSKFVTKLGSAAENQLARISANRRKEMTSTPCTFWS